jgi:hypothetical protein
MKVTFNQFQRRLSALDGSRSLLNTNLECRKERGRGTARGVSVDELK